MELDAAQLERAGGVLLALAVGDALGSGYEHGEVPQVVAPEMLAGPRGAAPGEWSDDTAQAVVIARVAATGADLRSRAALDAVAQGFAEWFAEGPGGVGAQTAQVLRAAGNPTDAARMRAAARAVHERTGRSAGNGSLMRTAPVALAHLDDAAALVAAAVAVSELTHHQHEAGEAAALWSLMVRHAVLFGELPRACEAAAELTDLLGRPCAADWATLLAAAEHEPPATFVDNRWSVGALQAAWSAITHTPLHRDQPGRHLVDTFATAISIGNDTDTVAAIAGALLGALWGAGAVPARWADLLHGWGAVGPRPADELVRWALLTVRGGNGPG